MISCPLCNSSKYFHIKDYKILELSYLWKFHYKFNPFENEKETQIISKFICHNCELLFYYPKIKWGGNFYKNLSKNNWYYEDNKWEFEIARNIIKKNQRNSLLEIGCGNGNFLKQIKDLVNIIQGTEINEDAIASCKKIGLDVTKCDLEKINNKFGFIVMFEVLEHLENLDNLFSNIYRILDDDGILIIAVPNPDSYLKYIDPDLLDIPPHHFTGWNYKTFEYLSKEFNFEILTYEKEPLRFVHYKYYLNSIINHQNIKLKKNIFKSMFIRLSEFFLLPMTNKMDYLLYLKERKDLIGQTHIIAFNKKIM